MTGSDSLSAEMFAALDRKGVAHALLRDDVQNEGSDDLDLLVWPEDRDRFVRVVEGLGFWRERRRIPKKEVFYAWERDRLYVLDVHYALIQGGLVYLELPASDSVVGHRPPRLAPVDELLHLVFHELLGKGGITPKRIGRVRKLIEEGAGRDVPSRLADARMLSVVLRVLAEPAEYLPGSLPAKQTSRRLAKLLLRNPSNLWHRMRRRALRRLRPHRGLLVAFLGVDGAGKSTTLDAVAQALQDTGRVPLTRTYMGPWGQFRTRMLKFAYRRGLVPPSEDWLQRLRERLRGDPDSPPVSRSLTKWAKGRVRGWSYYGSVYYDLGVRYIEDIRPALASGRVVLSDRYIYDLRHLHHNRPASLFAWPRVVLTRLFPRPHMVVFLHGDPDVITTRKPQLTSAAVASLQEIYRQALSGLPVIEINTDEPVKVVADHVTGRILQAYFQRR